MRPIIRVENLSKRYRIGARQMHNSLRDTVAAMVRSPLNRQRNGEPVAEETIWALKDVNFEVMPGEVIGVIGRNGAGKSTLLKILSRITRPTKGRVSLNGRVGSLLEVGTGFHAELTGRENIFLNGAILGMSKQEIGRKFDEIVAFAETETFLDTPVKHYSSGMTVRLAFAVAAHLEPEILIVDEVLAVGDALFQKKCLGKMNEISRAGRTVLFVSHDISAVNALCERAILLHEGSIAMSGATREVSAYYMDHANKLYSPITWIKFPEGKSNEIELTAVTVTQLGAQTNMIDCRESFTVTVEYENKKAVRNSRFFLLVRNEKGEPLFTSSDYDLLNDEEIDRKAGKFVSRISLPGGLFKAGSYYGTVGADIKYERIIFAENDIFHFDVFESGDDTHAVRHQRVGIIAPLLPWETTRAKS
ncbi:MAG: ABC transporter ATP-binding protein [Pyrinomonadaceae bacterium]|nr:ABC transporter ATP-binding protein [Pyrinomonadaceae bacterium]